MPAGAAAGVRRPIAADGDGLLYWAVRALLPAFPANRGAVAHLGERFNGIEEVGGSSPPSSTSLWLRLEATRTLTLRGTEVES